MEINATLLVSAISFLVFIFIMNKILYKPILEIMEKRQNYIDTNKTEAKEYNDNAQLLVNDKTEKIAQAQRQSRDIVASKAEALKEEKNKVLNDTKNELASYFEAQKQDLVNQKEQATFNLKYDVADLANRLTTKLMGEGVAFEPLAEHQVEEVMKDNV